MAIKVDLEKAYDRLNWSFIHKTLQELNLPTMLINLIMECITMATMNVLWNDDLLLLSEASNQQAIIINKFVEDFSASSGAKVIQSVTGTLGKYLGIPLCHNRMSRQTYQSIIDKVDQRLSGWNASHLILVGRITLAQSVLQAIHVYAMQTTNLPRSIKMKIDQLCRRFIWSGSAEHQKMSLVNEDTICTPKCKGGHGFKKLNIMNHALLMKNTWQLITEPTELSNQVLLTKYGIKLDEVLTNLPTRYGSHFWKAMGNIWEKTRVGMRWNIGDWKKVSHLLPNNILLKSASIHLPKVSHGANSYFWGVSSNGIFSVKSAYELLDDPVINADRNFWRLAWSWKGPHSIRVFLWLLLHGRLKTRKEFHRRHLVVSTQCDRCGGPVEDILHTLRDCVMARREYWRVCFGVAVWRLWFWRNDVLFNHGSWESGFIATDIKARTHKILLLSAELWGLLHGLRVAWDHGFRRLQLEVDNKSIVHFLERAHPSANENAILVKAVRELLARD
ncbi:putative ribonuclease H protein [Citrus sinensis]|nr:putative ribonuclease H protein [Citrus sinensis]